MRWQWSWRFLVLACLALSLSTVGIATGAAKSTTGGDGYYIDWYAISVGGSSDASSATYVVRGSVGQSVVGAATSGRYLLDAGFWFGLSTDCVDCIFAHGFEETEKP